MAIVTISRQIGSLGTEIARALAEALHYDYLDKETFEKALSEHGISRLHIEKYDEKRPALWDVFSSDRDRYLVFMRMAIYEFARKGNAVIVGRGGQVLLKDLPGTLSIMVEAPMPVRLGRIMDTMNCDAKAAEHIIRNSDHDRIGFHRFFFNINWGEKDIYDLVLNTKTLKVESTVSILREAVKVEEIKDRSKEAAAELENLTLGQQVEACILYEEEVPIQYLEVKAEQGVVTLRGAVTTLQIADRCEKVARSVDGVKDVINEFSLINYYGMM